MEHADTNSYRAPESIYPIESGIVLSRRRDSTKYPLASLEVGDSFLVPGAVARRLATAASQAGKRLGRKFATRKVEGGVRVWRLE